LGSEKRQRCKDKRLKYKRIDDLKKVARMEQRYFINSWLLPCSLRSHRIANPRPKMGFAIFRLCPPTTLQVWTAQRFDRVKKKNEVI
jgi:hypothetical protein